VTDCADWALYLLLGCIDHSGLLELPWPPQVLVTFLVTLGPDDRSIWRRPTGG